MALRRFARDFVWVSLAVACLTGALVYVAVAVLLVRPMRRIIGSIAAFRAAPERSLPLNPQRVSLLANDEMAVAGRELAAMQEELRNALWRNARLAALGSAVARISHDLRGILAPALLTAERLQNHPDAAVQRAGEVLLRTVDRATDLVRRTLDFAREGPPPLDLAPVELAPLVDEAGEAVRAPGRPFAVVNRCRRSCWSQADRNQFFRVLANLLRNAADAGARSAQVSAAGRAGTAIIDLADDGPGLPDAVRATLFRPFAHSTRHDGAGLGLAIARDLMLAHGGEIALASSGPEGTVFRLTLRCSPRLRGMRRERAGIARGPADASRSRGLCGRRTAMRGGPGTRDSDRMIRHRSGAAASARGIAPRGGGRRIGRRRMMREAIDGTQRVAGAGAADAGRHRRAAVRVGLGWRG